MAWYENIPRARWDLIDREGTIAHLDLHFQLDADLDALWLAIKAESRFLALSDCAFYGRSLTVGAAQTGAAEPTGSNLSYCLLVMHSETNTHSSMMIPGLRSDLLLPAGCFAAQKLDMLHPDVAALCSAITDGSICTERGDLIVDCSSGGALNLWTVLDRRSG